MASQGAPQPAQSQPGARQTGENLDDPHYGNLPSVHQRPATGGPHPVAATAEELGLAEPLAQGLNQQRPVQVSRSFSRRYKNAKG